MRDRARRTLTIAVILLVEIGIVACATLTPEGARVKVYRAPLDAHAQSPPPSSKNAMPDGCRVIATKPRTKRSELDLEGQKDPFRKERNEAAAAGANALLVRTRQTIGRRDLQCPSTSPITDCPARDGAWFEVVVESYACTPDALRKLTADPAP